MQFVDTNIFIRHLTNDNPVQSPACRALFERADRGEVELTTSEAVISEIVFVLASPRLYGVSRDQIRNLLYPILTLPGFKLQRRGIYLRALDIYAAVNLDFEDVFTIAHMEHQQITSLISYDQDFDRVQDVSITRIEP